MYRKSCLCCLPVGRYRKLNWNRFDMAPRCQHGQAVRPATLAETRHTSCTRDKLGPGDGDSSFVVHRYPQRSSVVRSRHHAIFKTKHMHPINYVVTDARGADRWAQSYISRCALDVKPSFGVVHSRICDLCCLVSNAVRGDCILVSTVYVSSATTN